MKKIHYIFSLSMLFLCIACEKLEFEDIKIGKENEPVNKDVIDLGLSVKWANMNLGATNPTEIGNSYQLSDVNKNIAANPLYDKAIIEWGEPWRMPTKAEAEELLNECTWTFTSKDRVEGYKVTGPNGQSLFFPCTNDTRIYLWTGTYYRYGDFYYFNTYLDNDDRLASLIVKEMSSAYYSNSKYIRPVQAK